MIDARRPNHSVCIVCEFPPPPGGMAHQAELLARLLSEYGISVQRCRTNVEVPPRLKPIEKTILVKLFVKLPTLIWRMFTCIRRCNIVHILSIPGMAFFVITAPAVLIARMLRKRVVISYHAGFFADFYAKWRAVIFPLLSRADSITTSMGYLEPQFSSAGFRTTVLPNVVDLKRFPFKKRQDYRPKFICTRHLRQVYGADIVIRAFSIIAGVYPDASLTLVGGGDMEDFLRGLAAELGVSESVEFTGYVDNRELPKLYDQADIFLNGSRRDNMPISILEAFASGLPVVTTNPMGIPHLVKEGVTGFLVDVDDADNLARKAMSLVSQPEIGHELVNNAKRLVDSLSWDSIRPRLFAVYGITQAPQLERHASLLWE